METANLAKAAYVERTKMKKKNEQQKLNNTK